MFCTNIFRAIRIGSLPYVGLFFKKIVFTSCQLIGFLNFSKYIGLYLYEKSKNSKFMLPTVNNIEDRGDYRAIKISLIFGGLNLKNFGLVDFEN